MALENLKDQWMTTNDFANLKGCTASTIRSAGHRGDLEMGKIGTTLLIKDPKYSDKNKNWKAQEYRGSREDGRNRYLTYFHDDELEQFRVDFGDTTETEEPRWRDPRDRG